MEHRPYCPSCISASHLFSLELLTKNCVPLLPAHTLGMLLAMPKRTTHFTDGERKHREIKALTLANIEMFNSHGTQTHLSTPILSGAQINLM